MPQNFRSSAQYIEHPLDCRRLTLSLRYFHLRKEQVIDLAEWITQWVRSFAEGQFVFDCYCNQSYTKEKNLFSQIVDDLNKDNRVSVGYCAYNVSPAVYNKTSMRAFQRKLKGIHPVYSFGWDVETSYSTDESIDYPRYFNERFPLQRPEKEQLIDLVHQVFQEEGKVYRTLHVWSDFNGGFQAEPYRSDPDLFGGSAYISFGSFCLGDSIQETAELLAEFATEIASMFVHVNAQVALQPAERAGTGYRNPYMKYFGSYVKPDGVEAESGYSFEEWYPTYYICGIEWFNLLSPLTAHRLPEVNSAYTRKTPWGGIIIQSPKKITEYDVSDAMRLKRILKPVIYPGISYITMRGMFPWQNTRRIYSWCPRFNWAIVPVEKHEIEIIGSNLVFDNTNSPSGTY